MFVVGKERNYKSKQDVKCWRSKELKWKLKFPHAYSGIQLILTISKKQFKITDCGIIYFFGAKLNIYLEWRESFQIQIHKS